MKLFAFIIFLGAFSYSGLAQEPPQTASTGKSSNQSKETSRSTASDPSDEKGGWEKVSALTDPASRAKAARAYLETFPDSSFHSQAVDLLVRSEIEEGHRLLQAEDREGAVSRFVAGITAAMSPLDDKLFNEILSKLPEKVYFGGTPAQGFRIADLIESKIQNNADQLLTLANFYLSVEQGSKALDLAEAAIKIKPDSAAAYRTEGLARRMEFQMEQSASAYEKAMQLDPDSDVSRRGLAEMKRALGKADEAAQLFVEILSKDPTNVAAKTGLILSMFDAGKRSDAEKELAKSLGENPRNVLLLAGAAYWYATNNEGDKAVELARQAIEAEPRFVWSHIALARGLLLLSKPYDAEKALLAARRYGNFPTLEYEIASARLAAGFFRDAAEEISKSFAISDGNITTKLGGRISRSAKDFSTLIDPERRASIFIPQAARNNDSDMQLVSLLEFKQVLDSPTPDMAAALRAIDQFVQGSDPLKVHRQIYSAGLLLDNGIALERAAELAQSATANVDAGLNTPYAASATLAGELYERRSIAAARGEYLNVPEVPRGTLSAIVRGRIEEINGWARFQMGEPAAAVVRLKRAVNVLPANSAWSQSASWRLGSALAASGKEAEALDVFIKTYKEIGLPDVFRYDTIATLYRKLRGNTDDLQTAIGPDPRQPAAEVAENSSNTSETDEKEKEERAIEKPVPAPGETPTLPLPSEEPIPASGIRSNVQPINEVSDTKLAKSAPEEASQPETVGQKETVKAAKDLFPPVVITIPRPQASGAIAGKTIPYLPNPVLDKKSSGSKEPVESEPSERLAAESERPGDSGSKTTTETANFDRDTGSTTRETSPCVITASEDSITLLSGSGGRAVIVGIDDEIDIQAIKGLSLSPEHVSVKREPITGIHTRALFVIKSVSALPGVYQVNFELPCGKKTIVVSVR